MMTGSMAKVPKDLLDEVKKLEKMFTVETPKLKEITSHFVGELEKGMCSLCALQPAV
jgi:hexokinase